MIMIMIMVIMAMKMHDYNVLKKWDTHMRNEMQHSTTYYDRNSNGNSGQFGNYIKIHMKAISIA